MARNPQSSSDSRPVRLNPPDQVLAEFAAMCAATGRNPTDTFCLLVLEFGPKFVENNKPSDAQMKLLKINGGIEGFNQWKGLPDPKLIKVNGSTPPAPKAE